ncbi:MAG: tRNA nucleotidyltransferase [Firmicutes bacterium]|nr:tRNA nucleotidyltransferase [Bacillota bacterium]
MTESFFKKELSVDLKSDLKMAQMIAERVRDCGGRTYFVGGYVRDRFLNIENKDIDIEVHGISEECFHSILDDLGTTLIFGESFRVYSLKGYSLDISLPRKENSAESAPFIGSKTSAKRRDLTCNALMQDVLSGEILDHFGGIKDMEGRILRHCDDVTFSEDPLRVLRAARLSAELGFSVAKETVALCRGLDLSALPSERIEGELKKALLLSERPSVFFEQLREMDGLDVWFPELKALIGVEQNPRHHMEGDVWTHTMLVLDEAVCYRREATEPFGFMLAALCHDYGKAICTEMINGELHSYQHEVKGLPLVQAFLDRITSEKKLHRYVLNMVELHMRPNFIAAANASVKSTNKMFDLAISPEDLLLLSFADGFGTHSPVPYVPKDDFLYERLSIYREYMERPYVKGKDLIAAGLKPDTDFSEILAYAHKLRLAGIEKKNALKQTLAYARKMRKDTLEKHR